MNIYCGNISFRATSQDIEKLFESFGEVSSARVITDRETGRSRGFAIVEMENDDNAQQAIDSLHFQFDFEKGLHSLPPKNSINHPKQDWSLKPHERDEAQEQDDFRNRWQNDWDD